MKTDHEQLVRDYQKEIRVVYDDGTDLKDLRDYLHNPHSEGPRVVNFLLTAGLSLLISRSVSPEEVLIRNQVNHKDIFQGGVLRVYDDGKGDGKVQIQFRASYNARQIPLGGKPVCVQTDKEERGRVVQMDAIEVILKEILGLE